MHSKSAAQNVRPKEANSATPWAVAALFVWSALLATVAAFTGMFDQFTRHDFLIAALGLCFVLMAFASVALLRRNLQDYISPARNHTRRTRR